MRYHVVTLGCAKNSVDSDSMAELLEQAGFKSEREQQDYMSVVQSQTNP